MTPHARALFEYLAQRRREAFVTTGRIDQRRYLAREFPADFPLLISLQSYPAYKRMVGENWMHWHDYYELWVATGGAGEYRAGNHEFGFSAGDVILVDPLKIHGVLKMSPEHQPLVLFFKAEAVAPTGAAVDLEFLSAWDRRGEQAQPRLLADAPQAAAVHASLLRLVHAWFDEAPGGPRAVTLKFHLLETLFALRSAFAETREGQHASISMRTEREARLRQVLEYVAERCHTTLGQPEVARAVGMSTSRFRAFFKETTGWGFADYLRDLRLERAARRLRESVEPISEIAYETGFSDQSHLQRLFKAKHGISPLAYRRQHQPKVAPAAFMSAGRVLSRSSNARAVARERRIQI